jgi:NAD(P)-dependent dehydrogenase (short-subunit alcohol dehydrogenase family)
MNGGSSRDVAVVSGAGTSGQGVGVGTACAVVLAGAGAHVALVDLIEERATDARDKIPSDRVSVHVGDVSRPADCNRMIGEVADLAGPPTILVNNVALPDGRVPVHELDPDSWDEVLRVTLTGMMLMSRAASPHMVAGGRGSIVNISSISGILAGGTFAYGAAKAGVNQLSRDMALRYGPAGIRVNVVAPGAIQTPMAAGHQSPEARAIRRRLTQLATEGTSWHVAHAVAFLCSDKAEFISGACLPVDGGASSALIFSADRLLDLVPDQ